MLEMYYIATKLHPTVTKAIRFHDHVSQVNAVEKYCQRFFRIMLKSCIFERLYSNCTTKELRNTIKTCGILCMYRKGDKRRCLSRLLHIQVSRVGGPAIQFIAGEQEPVLSMS